MEFVQSYWPVFLIALIIGAIVGYLIFRPRQRVSLTENTPLRPHMTAPPQMLREGRGLTDEAFRQRLLAAAGRAPSTWEDVAAATLDVYARAIRLMSAELVR